MHIVAKDDATRNDPGNETDRVLSLEYTGSIITQKFLPRNMLKWALYEMGTDEKSFLFFHFWQGNWYMSSVLTFFFFLSLQQDTNIKGSKTHLGI